MQAHCALAQQLGARVLTGQQVVAWHAATPPPPPPSASASSSSGSAGQHSSSNGPGGPPAVRVATACGRVYTADALVLAGGPWMGQLVQELQVGVAAECQAIGKQNSRWGWGGRGVGMRARDAVRLRAALLEAGSTALGMVQRLSLWRWRCWGGG